MNTGALFPGHVILPADLFRDMESDLRQTRANYRHVSQELAAAEAACDEWEKKNGDAPHRAVSLADRIRVNAGLPASADGKQ